MSSVNISIYHPSGCKISNVFASHCKNSLSTNVLPHRSPTRSVISLNLFPGRSFRDVKSTVPPPQSTTKNVSF